MFALPFVFLLVPPHAGLAPTPVPFSHVVANADAADEAYRYIAGLFEKGHHDLVVKEAQRFLEKHRAHARSSLVRYRLATALFELGRPSEATPHYRQLTGESGFEYRAESWLRLGQCELLGERPAEARTALRQAHASEQTYLRPTAAFFLAEAEFQLADDAAAEAHYREALKSDDAATYHAHARRGLAWCCFRREDWAGCRAAARAFLSAQPNHELASEVRFLQGDAAFEAGDLDDADAAWAPIDAGAWALPALRGRAFVRSARGDDRGAAALFASLLERDDEGRYTREATVQCGAHLLRAGLANDALLLLSSRGAGTDPETLYWRAKAESATGDGEAALKTLERASRGAEGELARRIATLRGDVLFDLGRLEESAAAYGSDASDYALHAAATAQLNAGRPEEALRLATRFLEEHTESPYRATTLRVRAEAAFALQRYDAALTDYVALTEVGDDLEPAERARVQSRVGWCRYLGGDAAGAARAFGAVCKQFPRSPEASEARAMQGRALRESGDVEGAVAALQRYLAEQPHGAERAEVRLQLARLTGDSAELEELLAESADDPLAATALFELAESQSAEGRGDEAIASFRAFLARYPNDPAVSEARYGLAWELRAAGESRAALAELQRLDANSELALAAAELALFSATDLGEPALVVARWTEFAALCESQQALLAGARAAVPALQGAGAHEQAAQLLASLEPRLTDRPLRLELALERAWCALDAGQVEAAEPFVASALAAGPRDARVLEAAFFAGEAHYAEASYERAAPLYAHAAQPEAEELYDDALYKLGFTELSRERWAQAAAAFEGLVQAQPKSELFGESLFLAGECRYRAGAPQEAKAHLARFRKQVPRHAVRPRALFRLGVAAQESGDAKLAEAALTELLKTEPAFERAAEAHLVRGRALVALSKPRAARAAFDATLAAANLRTEDAVFGARARLELGRLAFDDGDHEEALGQFLKVSLLFASGQEVREATLLAGLVLEAQGKPGQAAQQYRQLVQDAPKSEEARAAGERLKQLRAD